MFQTLLEKFPKTPIMVITSQPRAEVEDNPTYNGEKRWGKNCPAYQINEALKEVCEHYAIPCLDLYSSSFIKPWITSNRNRLCPDGVHPNTEGQYVMAEQILPFVRSSWIPTENFANANVPLQGISMSHSTLTLEVGKQFTLNIIPTPSNASNANVTWKSSDSTKVKVEEAVLTGLAVGTSTITATSIEGGYTTTCEVTVVESGEGANIVSDGLVVYLDALDNTENSTTWSSRVGDLSGTMSNFNTTTSKYNETTKSIDLANQGSCTISGSGQTGSFTAECLMTLDGFNCSSTRIPFSNYSSSAINGGIGYLNRSTSVEISDRTGGTNVIASTTKDGSITTNYVLITITVDADKTTKLYLNSELKGSGTCNGFSNNDFILNHTSMTDPTKIGFASFRIYNRALTQSEIQTNLEAERMTRTF